MNPVWTPAALQDLAALRAHIEKDNPRAAERTALRITEAVERLERFPALGRPGRVPGTRELVVSGTAYIVPYRIRDERLALLRVLHGARRWPKKS